MVTVFFTNILISTEMQLTKSQMILPNWGHKFGIICTENPFVRSSGWSKPTMHGNHSMPNCSTKPGSAWHANGFIKQI
jgi:hypothetical protein